MLQYNVMSVNPLGAPVVAAYLGNSPMGIMEARGVAGTSSATGVAGGVRMVKTMDAFGAWTSWKSLRFTREPSTTGIRQAAAFFAMTGGNAALTGIVSIGEFMSSLEKELG